MGRLVCELAVATQIPPNVWVEQDEDVILTVLHILEKRNNG